MEVYGYDMRNKSCFFGVFFLAFSFILIDHFFTQILDSRCKEIEAREKSEFLSHVSDKQKQKSEREWRTRKEKKMTYSPVVLFFTIFLLPLLFRLILTELDV